MRRSWTSGTRTPDASNLFVGGAHGVVQPGIHEVDFCTATDQLSSQLRVYRLADGLFHQIDHPRCAQLVETAIDATKAYVREVS